MSVSSVSSSSAYALQWPSLSGTDSTSQSGAPSDALISLFQAFQGGGQTNGMGPPPPPPDGSSGGTSQFSSDTMSTMISMLGGQNSGTSPLDNLMSKLDTDGDGKVSQSEFEQAMGSDADKTKADALFAKMDKNGDGTVTKDELAQAIHKAHGHHHHGGAQQADGSQGTDPLQALLSGQGADGSSSQSTANSDGSTTTTITYADGTKISMTSPAATASSSSNSSDSTSGIAALNAMNLKNIIEKMIAAQAQMFTQQQSGTNVTA